MIFWYDDRNLSFYKKLTPSILDPEKNVSRTLNSPMNLSKWQFFFNSYIINMIEIAYNN